MPTRQLSRRHMLALAGLSAGLPILAACGTPATPSPAPKPAEAKPPTAAAAPTNTTAPAAKPTEAPKPAAAEPTKPAAAATTAPAATKPAEPTKPAAAATTAPTAAAAAKPAAGAKKIVFLIYGGQAEQAAWNAKADAFAKKYPGQAVEISLQPTDYNTKLLAQLASGTAPDTFAAFSVRELAPKGVLMQLDDRIKSDADFNAPDFLPGSLDGGKWQGKQFAIPGGLGPQVTFFNVDKFKAAGLASPIDLAAKGEWTYEKLLEASQKLTTKDAAGKVTTYGYLPYPQQYVYTYGWGARNFNADFSEAFVEEAPYVDSLQFVADIALKHKAAPLQAELQQYGSWQGFTQGNYGMFISGPWQQARLGGSPMKEAWDIAPPPLQKDGAMIMNAGGNGTAVYAKTPDPDTAYRWATFSESVEGQRIWAGLGFDLPSRKSLVEDYTAGKFFADPKFKPANNKLWYEVVGKAKPSPHTYLPAEAGDKLNAAWSNTLKGTGTAKDEHAKIAKDVNRVLKES
jgi:multiple sugar transport system substrate-binding protein